MTEASPDEARPSRRWRAAHVLALTSLAVTQPLLDVLGNNPTFFVAHGSGPGQVLLVCVLTVVVAPVVLVLLELLVDRVRPGWSWRFHLVVVGVLTVLVASAFLDDLVGALIDDLPEVSGPVTLLLAGGAAILFTRAYARRAVLQSVLSVLAAAPVLFVFVFAFASPANDLLFPAAVEAADVDVTGDQPPVVVVVFDELPLASVVTADGSTIDAERFPNLARLAGDGVWFPDATSVAGYTHEAVPAILTGQRVDEENLPPTASGHPESLFTLLAQDYEITAHEQLTELCTEALCERSSGGEEQAGLGVLLNDLGVVAGHVVLPATLEDWLPTVGDTWANFGQDPIARDQEAERQADIRADIVDELGELDRVGELRAAIEGIEAGPDPQLVFLHAVFPHVPWSHHADGSAYPDLGNPGLEDNIWTSEEAADRALQRHLLQAEFGDRLLGELLDELDAEGLYEDALIAFTADHGGSFMADTHRRLPEEATLPGIMPVPLVVKPPAGSGPIGIVDDRPAETVDIVPTVADVLGVELPWDVDGTSLFGPPPEPHERSIYARGETTSAGEGPLDFQPIVDHLWDRFGVGDGLQPYALGAGAAAVGDPVGPLSAPGDAEACWVPADPVEGTTGWVGGHLDTDLADPIDLGIVVDGRVAGTTTTYADEEQDHALFGLGDPALWPDDGEVSLWRIAEDLWLELDTC